VDATVRCRQNPPSVGLAQRLNFFVVDVDGVNLASRILDQNVRLDRTLQACTQYCVNAPECCGRHTSRAPIGDPGIDVRRAQLADWDFPEGSVERMRHDMDAHSHFV